MVISVCDFCAPLCASERPNEHPDFNLDFYTEVQDLSHLENALNKTSPRFTALNMALISVIEDYGLVGFETLAVEVGPLSNHPSHSLRDRPIHIRKGQELDAAPIPCH